MAQAFLSALQAGAMSDNLVPDPESLPPLDSRLEDELQPPDAPLLLPEEEMPQLVAPAAQLPRVIHVVPKMPDLLRGSLQRREAGFTQTLHLYRFNLVVRQVDLETSRELEQVRGEKIVQINCDILEHESLP